jgi:hypothetical protein
MNVYRGTLCIRRQTFIVIYVVLSFPSNVNAYTLLTYALPQDSVLIIIIIMALQPFFVGPWPLYTSFLISFTVGRTPWTPWTGGSASRKVSTYKQNNINGRNTHRHLYLDWDSNPRFQCSSERRPRPRGHCDRPILSVGWLLFMRGRIVEQFLIVDFGLVTSLELK